MCKHFTPQISSKQGGPWSDAVYSAFDLGQHCGPSPGHAMHCRQHNQGVHCSKLDYIIFLLAKHPRWLANRIFFTFYVYIHTTTSSYLVLGKKDAYYMQCKDQTFWFYLFKDTFLSLDTPPPPPPPPLHDHPQYTVLITGRTSKAYLI